MFSLLYFPIVSALTASAEQADEVAPWPVLEVIFQRGIGAAVQQSGRRLDELEAVPGARDLRWHADLLLLLGFDTEAEDTYRQAQRRMRAPKSEIRVVTCRNAAWQALFRHRIGTALACFSRVVDEADRHPARLAEARIGMVCVLHEMGRTADALTMLDDIDPIDRYWTDLIAALRFDLVMQQMLRDANVSHDHVYWHSVTSTNAPGYALPWLDDPSVQKSVTTLSIPLLAERMRYLLDLREMVGNGRAALAAASAYLDGVRQQGLVGYQRAVRLELALAALVGSAPQAAQTILEPLSQRERATETGHRQLEYLYCMSKLREAQGRIQESRQLYHRYALVAMQCLRENLLVRMPALEQRSKTALDDVSVRLPARYRGAYHYVLANLDRADLSVREIAMQIGVTERALQSAFKNFLGMSPSELIRGQRMERIREALMEESSPGRQNVLEAARRWGVQSRSTLAAGYRKRFRESPSDTLKR